MHDEKKSTLLELWPIIKEDMEKFISDRPGWLISALEKAREKKGSQGWKDIETIINILQFLKDTPVEY
jgi:hypothetical protein